MRVLAHLDTASIDLTNPAYRRKDADLPVALARTYGKGRTFWSNFGHAAETWDDPDIQQTYLEAIRWAMGLTPGDASPQAMKLLRYGAPGREKPGILDADGHIRDLSAIIPDLSGDALLPESLALVRQYVVSGFSRTGGLSVHRPQLL